MSLKYGLLGVLCNESATGYDLDKFFKESIGFFWHAQTRQIYKELTTMEEKQWLTSEIVFQTDKPNRKVYSITELGRAEFQKWILDDNSFSFGLKSELLMRVFFGGERDISGNINFLRNFKKKIESILGKMEESSEIKTLDPKNHKHVYYGLTVNYGVQYLKMCLEWAKTSIETLEKLQNKMGEI